MLYYLTTECCIDGQIRLAGRQNEIAGRLEVCSNGIWGLVRRWEFSDAIVFCREVTQQKYPGIVCMMGSKVTSFLSMQYIIMHRCWSALQ